MVRVRVRFSRNSRNPSGIDPDADSDSDPEETGEKVPGWFQPTEPNLRVHALEGKCVDIHTFSAWLCGIPHSLSELQGPRWHPSLVARIVLNASGRMGRHESTAPYERARSLQLRDQEMARLAHELNAPVSLIVGSLENLDHCLSSLRTYIAATAGRHETGPERESVHRIQGIEKELSTACELLAICREGVGRISHLAGTFGVSTQDTRSEAPPAKLDLASVVRRAVLFATASRGNGTAIELDLESTPALQGDFESLSAAFINLIVNALDAVADRPSPLVRLSLRYDAERQCIEFRVCDNGSGVDPESKERIFESFYTTKDYGSGLGLAIVREVLEGHGGSIDVVSCHGPGAEFIVRLPRQRKANEPDSSTGLLG